MKETIAKNVKKVEKVEKVELPTAENLARIAVSAQSIVNTVDSILRQGGAELRLADWALLQHLAAQKEGQPMGRIARRMGVSRQRIQKQAEALTQSRYVDTQETEDDKRSHTLTLTKLGANTLAAMSANWNDHVSKNEDMAKVKNLDGVRQKLDRLSGLLARVERAKTRAARAVAK